MKGSIFDFWNERASLKMEAGSRDLTAKMLEIDTLFKYINDDTNIAEFGCGNGITAIEIIKKYRNVKINAFDFSPEMIKEAKKLAEENHVIDKIIFNVADITNLPIINERFDFIYTERMLINLKDWNTQLSAIKSMSSFLTKKGKLLLIENSIDGLNEINKLRNSIGLESIIPPWHNLYLEDKKMTEATIPNCKLIDVIPYSATYYFLSRVINAWMANEEGKEPSYDAAINKLALFLPAIGTHAQGKLWIWEKVT